MVDNEIEREGHVDLLLLSQYRLKIQSREPDFDCCKLQ